MDKEPAAQSPNQPGLSGVEVKRLAAAGVAAVGLRQVAIRALGLGGTVVLARLLLPRDFGAVAVGLTLVSVFGFMGDAGMGAGLIRGPKEPERGDLASVLGLQVIVTVALATATAIIGLQLGLVGRVTALMVASLPIAAFRVPGVIVFERNLRYQPLVLIELLETLVYYGWAIATVLLGWGVWGLASASVTRSVVGALIINLRSPAGFVAPRISWSRVRPLLSFGLQYQAVSAVSLVRDQGLNVGTAVLAGIPVLGLWTLAYRILQVPFLLFDSLWRVSFPAMARLLAAGEEPGPILERGLAVAGLVTGGLLATLVGSAPALVPAVFGHQWTPVVWVIPWAAAGLMFGGPVSVATAGYLYAKGDSSSVLVSSLLHTVAWFLVAFPLLSLLGVQALGVGWMAASIVETVVLARRTRRHVPIRVLRHLALPAALGGVAGTAGWTAASNLGPTVTSTAAGALVAAAIYGLGMIIVQRSLVVDTLALGRQSLRSLGN